MAATDPTNFTREQIEALGGVISGNVGKARILTTDDYNWNSSTNTATEPYNCVAMWLLPAGFYTMDSSVQVKNGKDQAVEAGTQKFYLIGDYPGTDRPMMISSNSGYYRGVLASSGNLSMKSHVITDRNLENNLTTTGTGYALDARQGKALKDLVDSLAIRAAGAPTTSTVGSVGTLYEDTTNGKLYICTDATNPYVWEEVGAGGGSGPTVVQTTGTSITDVMSQNATTSMVFADPSTTQKVQIGNSASAGGNNSVAVGYGASSGGIVATAIGRSANSEGSQSTAVGFESVARGTNAVSLGHGATGSAGKDGTVSVGASAGANAGNASYSTQIGYFARATGNGGIALGSYSSASAVGEMNIGSNSTNYGYNSSNYRLLTGLYDGQSAHDAATHGQVISYSAINGAGAPTTATEGKYVGQLYYDTTNEAMYFLKTIDTTTDPDTYTWEALGGGSSVNVVQTRGTSETDVMSQKTSTELIYRKYGTQNEQIAIGNPSQYAAAAKSIMIGFDGNCRADGSRSIAIGGHSEAAGQDDITITAGTSRCYNNGSSTVILGVNAYSGYNYCVVLGEGANPTAHGQVVVGSRNGHGYNNTNYRTISGVHDGQGPHDAATVGQITPTTDSSAPTSSTAGRLGEIRIDTTDNSAYMCVVSDSVTPAYEWKKITA